MSKSYEEREKERMNAEADAENATLRAEVERLKAKLADKASGVGTMCLVHDSEACAECVADLRKAEAKVAALTKERDEFQQKYEKVAKIAEKMSADLTYSQAQHHEADEKREAAESESTRLKAELAKAQKDLAFNKENEDETRANAIYWRTMLEDMGVDTGAPQLRAKGNHGDNSFGTWRARAEKADAELTRLRERERAFIGAVAEMDKAGEKIIQECFQYRRDDLALTAAITTWDALIHQLKTEKIPALSAKPEPHDNNMITKSLASDTQEERP